MTDRYTKIVLTVIAVALAAIALQGFVGHARADLDGCGDMFHPCYVTSGAGGLLVTVGR